MLTKLIEKLNYERKNAIKNGIYHLIQIKFSYNNIKATYRPSRL
ncbi:hypothetical protein [Helicobacter pylori]|nr:hypothetical protein [Helicobacter pylori]